MIGSIRRMNPFTIRCAALMVASMAFAQAPSANTQTQGAGAARPRLDPTQSPASKPRPKPASPQIYTADQIREGTSRFASQCGFCHGRDATGGESGPDLTRSKLVAEDVGRQAGSPSSRRPPQCRHARLRSASRRNQRVGSFIHTQMDKFAALGGGRRTVEPEDLRTGNAEAGRAWFNGAGKCSGCHSPTGDLAGIGTRYQGLALLRRLLYPAGNPAPKRPTATVTLPSGEKISGPLAGEDEFSVTILDPSNTRRKYEKTAVKVKVDNPLSAHFDELSKYTDTDMHNVYAYLGTLK